MLVTFLIGLVVLLVWLYPTGADKTALRLLGQSGWFFVLAPLVVVVPWSVLMVILGEPVWLPWWLGVLAWVLFEECLKLWASRSESSNIRAFALVSLFGIWELMLAKPIFWLFGASEGWALGAEVAMAVPAVFLHLLTAAIYGFHFRARPELQLALCSVAHFAFNIAATLAADWTFVASALIMAPATALLVPSKSSARRGEWKEVGAAL